MRAEPLFPGREKNLPPRLIARAMERIFARLEPDPFGGCLLWPGAEVNGHGTIKIRPDPSPFQVHRIVYCGCVGPIPEGLLVLHTCDVGICARLEHLFLGDHCANSRDAAAKGRFFLQSHGHLYEADKNPNAKLGWAEVREMRRLHAAGAKRKDLVVAFGVSPAQVSRIVRNLQFIE